MSEGAGARENEREPESGLYGTTDSVWAREMHTTEGSAGENYDVSSVWEHRKGGLKGSKNEVLKQSTRYGKC